MTGLSVGGTATAAAAAAGARIRRAPAFGVLLAAGCVLLVVLCLASVVFGARDVSLDDIRAALGGGTDTFGQAAVVKRLPRTALAVLVGAALALSGAALQAITRNPIADPGVFGVSGGASFAVVIGIAFFGLANPYSTMGVAVIGAAAAALFVYGVGSLGGGQTPLKLALAGAATAAALVSLTSAIMLPRVDQLRSFQFWQVGGVGGATWERIAIVLPALVLGAVLLLACAKALNALALGDELATGLGAHVGRTRAVAALGAIVLAGAATAVAGPIGFVGLMVPHACRLLVGPDHRRLLPATALFGACLLVAADVLGRVVARPEEIEVGIVTAVVGAPVFIAIVRRQQGRAR